MKDICVIKNKQTRANLFRRFIFFKMKRLNKNSLMEDICMIKNKQTRANLFRRFIFFKMKRLNKNSLMKDICVMKNKQTRANLFRRFIFFKMKRLNKNSLMKDICMMKNKQTRANLFRRFIVFKIVFHWLSSRLGSIGLYITHLNIVAISFNGDRNGRWPRTDATRLHSKSEEVGAVVSRVGRVYDVVRRRIEVAYHAVRWPLE